MAQISILSSGVDATGIVELMDMLDSLRKTYDLSILMTTHDFGLLPRYADQAVLIDHRLLLQGAPMEVLASPEFQQVFRRKAGEA